ncbi:hypothetical protein HRI_000143600 [Hibiscus trionum]|uniref:Arabinogalactan peptide 23-like n=1 Tax=Hibiscus trionum TaxID=183268 RepID=A0A9W7LH39_HIBTR|nr:hypothetical protein HRI_000143600 [Hibiscus trionum]
MDFTFKTPRTSIIVLQTCEKSKRRDKNTTKSKEFVFPRSRSLSLFFNTMDMKKISCAVIVAAASMSAVMAADGPASAPGFGPAPGQDSGVASATLPVLGSLVGASLVSFFAYYLQ